MKRLLLTLSLLAVTACSNPTPSEITNTDAQTPGVVGGSEVSSSDLMAKSTVFIFAYNDTTKILQSCTASLIQQNVLITAAHCFLDSAGHPLQSPFRFYVKYSLAIDLNAPDLTKDMEVVSADQVRTHPKYQWYPSGIVANDIALVKLSQDAPSRYTATRFLKSLSALKPSTRVLVGGFGIHTWDHTEEDQGRFKLRSMNSFIIDINLSPSLQIPVKTWDGLSTAHGDSGGPAFVKVGGQNYLWGVDSTAIDGAGGRATYEPIPSHLPWLRGAAKDLKVSVDF